MHKTCLMGSPSLFQLPLFVIAIITLFLIIIFDWLGRRYRQRQMKKFPGAEHGNLGAIEGALLGLMTLMLAFSYGIAATRYETGRQLIVDEAKAITVAIHRCDLYPDSVRNVLFTDFKGYVESRIVYYQAGVDEDKIKNSLNDGMHHSDKIRKEVMALSQYPENRERSILMVPALDNMDDLALSSEAARESRLPQIILWMLLILTVSSGFLVGFGNSGKRKNGIMVIGFAIMTTAAFYLVIELDHPRQGFINLDVEVQNILNLRSLFK